MHDERKAREAGLDLLQHVEVQGLLALELEGAVRGADGGGEAVAAGLLDKSLRLGRIGQAGVAFLDLDVLLHAAEHAELGFDGDAFRMGGVHHTLGDRDVLGERIVGGVDHDRTVEAGLDAVVARLFVTVVEVHREDGVRKDLVGGADDRLEHLLVRVFARALGDLDDKRGLRLEAAAEQAHRLLRIVDVVGADGVFAVGVFEQLGRCNDHGDGGLKGTAQVTLPRKARTSVFSRSQPGQCLFPRQELEIIRKLPGSGGRRSVAAESDRR